MNDLRKRQQEDAEKTDRMISKRIEEVRKRLDGVEKTASDEKERVNRVINIVKKE